MKTQSIFLPTLAALFIYAGTHISAKAASPTIDFITNFTIPEPGDDTAALGINSAGEIVGVSNTPTDEDDQGFLRLRNGDFSDIIHPDSRFTVATAINDSGMIAGYYGGRTSGPSFFLADGIYTDFAIPGACATEIRALNNAGDFAGVAYFRVDFDCNSPKAFISVGGNVTIFTVPGGEEDTGAHGMNNLGQVVGDYYDGAYHGFLRDADGTLTFPIDYPGAAHTNLTGINDKGWMTGWYIHIEGDFHGIFLQSPTAEFVSFDANQSQFTTFGGINNRGFICGSYYDDSGVENGFLARVRRSSGE